MDRHGNVSEMFGSEHSALLVSAVEPLFSADGFDVRTMCLTWPKLALLWTELKKYRTLFSDLTRGDLHNFIKYITDRDTLWFEVWKEKELVGIVTLEGVHQVVDVQAHIMFFDRVVSDKAVVSKAIIAWLFEKFPLQRISVQVPILYYATIRLVLAIGFKHEGTLRNAVLINRKWIDVKLLGITRQEVAVK